MSEPFLGQVSVFSFGFAPKGWAQCNGQLLPINQNQALFSLLGTTFGGDGTTTFALPNLRGRVPIHTGGNFVQGAVGGEEFHTLVVGEIPSHTHTAVASSATADQASPSGNLWAAPANTVYSSASNSAMAAQCVSAVGGGQPHENRSPLLVVNFCIALQGIFPSRN